MFPTSIRSTASGCLYLFSRIGGIAAPYGVAYLTYPQYIVSAILFLTLFLVLPLKETKGQKLKEDIEENSLVKQDTLDDIINRKAEWYINPKEALELKLADSYYKENI